MAKSILVQVLGEHMVIKYLGPWGLCFAIGLCTLHLGVHSPGACADLLHWVLRVLGICEAWTLSIVLLDATRKLKLRVCRLSKLVAVPSLFGGLGSCSYSRSGAICLPARPTGGVLKTISI